MVLELGSGVSDTQFALCEQTKTLSQMSHIILLSTLSHHASRTIILANKPTRP